MVVYEYKMSNHKTPEFTFVSEVIRPNSSDSKWKQVNKKALQWQKLSFKITLNQGNGGILAPEPIRRPQLPQKPEWPQRPQWPQQPPQSRGCAANATHFQCSQRIHECIPRYLLCDGEFDCTDGSDEFTCPSSIRNKRGISTLKVK